MFCRRKVVLVRLLSKKAPLIAAILWPKTLEILWSKWDVLMVRLQRERKKDFTTFIAG